ncbi:MAG: SDR family NAD(P)-dependent oxidoreductase [Bacteroidota bacterium]
MTLTDRVAVVTGASRGIGLACAEAFLDAGMQVYALARSTDDLEAHRERLGERLHPVRCNVTNVASVDAAFAQIDVESSRCDVLVNNAGLGKFGPVDDLSLDAWNVQIETNLNGVFYCTRRAVPLMKRQFEATSTDDAPGYGGHIVHIASVAGLVGNPQLAAYNATKFGLRGFAEATMKELRPHGIRTTCIYPGSVDTHFGDVAGITMSPNAMKPEDIAASVLHAVQMPVRTLVSEIVLRPLRVGK